jgi:1-deoxyxylulose-5-phosphate synthase
MEHLNLGRSGLKVSRFAFGTMTFGFQTDENEAIRILDAVVDAGITSLDTADAYPLGAPAELRGRTEEILGKWLKGRRHRFIVATKVFGQMGPDPWDKGNSRRHILSAVDSSLRRLGTDWIDLYQLHGYDPDTPIDETLLTMADLVRAGKVRYIGCSNFRAYQVAISLGRSDLLSVLRFTSVQPRHNLLFREAESELFPLCAEEGLGVLTYNPLAGGMLTGKYALSDAAPNEGRFGEVGAGHMYRNRYWNDRNLELARQIAALARDAGLKPAQMALAWTLTKPAITAPILGVSRLDQLKDLLGAAEVRLPSDLVAKLDELTDPTRLQ